MSKSLKKIVEESRDKNLLEVEICDRGISSMLDIPGLCRNTFLFITHTRARASYSVTSHCFSTFLHEYKISLISISHMEKKKK